MQNKFFFKNNKEGHYKEMAQRRSPSVCEWQDIINDVYSMEALTLSLRQRSTNIHHEGGERLRRKDLIGYLCAYLFTLLLLSLPVMSFYMNLNQC